VNEYRAEKAAEALHDQIDHEGVVTRDGKPDTVDATDLVPGDLVDLHLGDIVPADLRPSLGDGAELAAAAAFVSGHRVYPRPHDLLRPAEFVVRLPHLRRHVVGLPRRGPRVPIRLVR